MHQNARTGDGLSAGGPSPNAPGLRRRGGAPTSLLGRVRHRFTVLLWLLLLVEVVEWFDAGTALFPDRSIAAVGMAIALLWSLALRRLGRSTPALELAPPLAIVLIGWGLGRPGATLALLLGAALLRAVYGSRRSVLLATAGLVGAYTVVGIIHDGVTATLTDLGLVTVGVALASFAWVIRQVAEVMAKHDVVSTWDDVLSTGGHDLLAATNHREVRATVRRILTELTERTPAATGGLFAPPVVPDVRIDAPLALDPALPVELWDRLDRLRTDALLASDLLQSEARYRDLAEQSRDGIYVRALGPSPRLVYTNPAAALLGARPVGLGAVALDLDLVHPDDHAALAADSVDASYLQHPITVRLLDAEEPDGHRWVEVVETPSAYTRGGLVTVQGTIRDVSTSQRQERALADALEQEQRAADRLRSVDELRATFLAAVSHELRTPLAGLLGASETLVAHRERLTEEQSIALQGAVSRQATRLRGLLDDLLDVERLGRGQLEPVRRMTALMPLVYCVIGTYDGDTSRVSIHGDDAVVVDVDPAQVERIIDNLVRNALKHTPDEVPIRVLIEPHEQGALLIVEDDGPGVPPSLRDGIFAPFVQGPESKSHPSPGTGIGLSLVSKFAELHGGRAWIEESSSGGARFVVLLVGQRVPDPEPADHAHVAS